MRTSLATLGCLLVALVPAPAQAEDLSVPDGRDDYWHDTRSSGEDPYPGVPDYGDPDLVRTTYRHGDTRVVTRLKLARLERSDGGYWRGEVRFRTDTGLMARAEVFRAYDGPTVTRWRGPGTCVVDGKVDWADDVLVVSVPRACLRRPATVELTSATKWAPTSDDYPYLDVSGSDGYRLNAWSAPLSRG
ncbi:hypothetical protein [Nocardioides stalactiti]|uniref:hypothetical protein n=1 Tax=Nocardioides stalactiti TaxID=2755356 RepID=UPI001602E057|nr:hypothetical protein [Nocardioides stalactiti]